MRSRWLLLLAVLVAAGGLFAQDQTQARGVWIASMQGAVSFLAAGANASEWSPAELNRPLVVGDQLATVDDGTAELRVEAHVLHLGPGTIIELGRIEGRVFVVDLRQGSLDAAAPRLSPGEIFEVDTQNLSMSLSQSGHYLFELDSQGNTKDIVVRDGLCQAVTAAGQSYTVQTGQQANVMGGNQPQLAVQQMPDLGQSRPDEIATGPGPQAPVDPGADTLAPYGNWQTTPDNTQGWYPNVSADWAPYTQGQWDYIEPGGWTWVDSEPWGFTPFHYGRWGFGAGRWYWVPGPAIYSPALVAWLGGGPGMLGMVGWFPLGPREPYYPIGGYFPGGIRYANARFATVVSHETFVGATPVFRSRISVPVDVLRRAPVSNYAAIAPTRASVVGNRRAFAHPSPYIGARAVVARTPHAAPALPLERRQQSWSQAPGRPLSNQQVHTGGYASSNVRLVPGRTPSGQTYQPRQQPGQAYGQRPQVPQRPAYQPPPRPAYQPPQPARPQTQPRPAYQPPQPSRQPPPRPAYKPPAQRAAPPAPHAAPPAPKK